MSQQIRSEIEKLKQKLGEAERQEAEEKKAFQKSKQNWDGENVYVVGCASSRGDYYNPNDKALVKIYYTYAAASANSESEAQITKIRIGKGDRQWVKLSDKPCPEVNM